MGKFLILVSFLVLIGQSLDSVLMFYLMTHLCARFFLAERCILKDYISDFFQVQTPRKENHLGVQSIMASIAVWCYLVLVLLFSTLSSTEEYRTKRYEESFRIIYSNVQKQTHVEIGGSFYIGFTTNKVIGSCTFTHEGHSCLILYPSTSKKCTEFGNRVVSIGLRDMKQCWIRVREVTARDAGEWACEVHSRRNGHVDHNSVNVNVLDEHRSNSGAENDSKAVNDGLRKDTMGERPNIGRGKLSQ